MSASGIDAFDFISDGADDALAGVLDPRDHAGLKLQHFAELGGDGHKALAQGRRCGLAMRGSKPWASRV
jgi:hypothetical protein